jgi:hypothetical protein
VDSPNNIGGFMLIDTATNLPVDGFKFDLAAEYVIEHCKANDVAIAAS